jgi:hypothetical protein
MQAGTAASVMVICAGVGQWRVQQSRGSHEVKCRCLAGFGPRPRPANVKPASGSAPAYEARSIGKPARVVATVSGALVGFLLLNLLVGIAVLRSPGRRMDPTWGDVMRPGTYVMGGEGYCITKLSSIGFRAPEPSAVRAWPERLLFLGDSYTEAFQMMDRDTYVMRVQEALRARGLRVACVNAGVSGQNAASYLYLAEALKTTYRPTRVVIQMGDGDFGSALLGARDRGYWLEPAGAGWIPRAAQIAAGTDRARDLLTRAPALYWLFQRWKKAAADTPPSDAIPSDSDQSGDGPDTVPVDWVLRELRARYGADVAILWTPAFDYFDGANGPTQTETDVAENCARLGIGFIDTRRAFAAEYARTRQPLQGFSGTALGEGHWNAAAHALVAAELVRYLDAREGTSQ